MCTGVGGLARSVADAPAKNRAGHVSGGDLPIPAATAPMATAGTLAEEAPIDSRPIDHDGIDAVVRRLFAAELAASSLASRCEHDPEAARCALEIVDALDNAIIDLRYLIA
jgi:hypothetical protein